MKHHNLHHHFYIHIFFIVCFFSLHPKLSNALAQFTLNPSSECQTVLQEDLVGTPFEDYTVNEFGFIQLAQGQENCHEASAFRCEVIEQYTDSYLYYTQIGEGSETVCGCQCTEDYCDQYINDDVDQTNYNAHGLGTESDPYRVYNGFQLFSLATHISALDQNYIQCQNIDMNDAYSSNTPHFFIGVAQAPFKGGYNGNNFSIDHYTFIDAQSLINIGLFGVTLEANLKNISLTNAYVSLANGIHVGSLVGFANRTRIDHCHAHGTVYAKEKAGGLVGMISNANAYNSSANVHVTATEYAAGGFAAYVRWGSQVYNSTAMGDVTGKDEVGGFTADMQGVGNSSDDINILDNCIAKGNVSATGQPTGGLVGKLASGEIYNSSALGNINGRDTVGGLIGTSSGGYIENVFAQGHVTGSTNYIGGLMGKNFGTDIVNAYALGNVHGDTFVGGLVGQLQSSSVQNVYSAQHSVIGSNYVGGLIGRIVGSSTLDDSFSIQNTITSQNSQVGTIYGALQFIGSTPPSINNCHYEASVNCSSSPCNTLDGQAQTPESYFYDSNNQPMIDWNGPWIFDSLSFPYLQ